MWVLDGGDSGGPVDLFVETAMAGEAFCQAGFHDDDDDDDDE